MSPEEFVLYTYQTVDGKTVCSAYGPTSASAAGAAGAHLQAEAAAVGEPALGYMVLELKPLPAAES